MTDERICNYKRYKDNKKLNWNLNCIDCTKVHWKSIYVTCKVSDVYSSIHVDMRMHVGICTTHASMQAWIHAAFCLWSWPRSSLQWLFSVKSSVWGEYTVFTLAASLQGGTWWHAQYRNNNVVRNKQILPCPSLMAKIIIPICIRNVVEPIGVLCK